MKFLKYEQNNESPENSYGLMGIATLIIDDAMVSYCVQQGKDGNGFFAVPFSKKMNDQWHKGYLKDSNIQNEEIKELIRSNVNAHYNKPAPAVDESEVPF